MADDCVSDWFFGQAATVRFFAAAALVSLLEAASSAELS